MAILNLLLILLCLLNITLTQLLFYWYMLMILLLQEMIKLKLLTSKLLYIGSLELRISDLEIFYGARDC